MQLDDWLSLPLFLMVDSRLPCWALRSWGWAWRVDSPLDPASGSFFMARGRGCAPFRFFVRPHSVAWAESNNSYGLVREMSWQTYTPSSWLNLQAADLRGGPHSGSGSRRIWKNTRSNCAAM